MSFRRLLLAALVLAAVGSAVLPAGATDWAVAVFPSGAEFTLEVANDVPSRMRGYMFREHVGPHEGMLLVFGEDDRHGIWMRNFQGSQAP